MILAFPHEPQKHGGPGSFQLRFERELKERGWNVVYAKDNVKPDIIMLVGGTRKLGWLLNHKISGVPIICRLDGINWLHRKTDVSKKKWLLNESRNFLFQIIRTFFASHIIYQSKFVLEWWQLTGWYTNARTSVIHNGIDLSEFNINKSIESREVSLLCVEGNIDYTPYAIDLLNRLQKSLITKSKIHSIKLYGSFQDKRNREKLNDSIDYRGMVSRQKLPLVYRNAIYLSLDINAACPNTVIEALASGIPVIGFDTGALKELVDERAGQIVSYGGDPWGLEFPDLDSLYEAARKVADNWSEYSKNARQTAEDRFNMEEVANQYIEILEQELYLKNQ